MVWVRLAPQDSQLEGFTQFGGLRMPRIRNASRFFRMNNWKWLEMIGNDWTRLASASMMVTTDGATDTLTFFHWSGGTWLIMESMASLIVSIPLGRRTGMLPRYCAFNTLRGSSIGVGKLWPVKQRHQWLYPAGIPHKSILLDRICPILVMDRRCSEGRLLGLLRAVPTGAVEFAPETSTKNQSIQRQFLQPKVSLSA